MARLAVKLGPRQAFLRHDRLGFGQRAPAQQSFGLGEAIGDQKQVLVGEVGFMALFGHKKLARNDARPLVDQLVKGVLAVRARLSPDHGA